MLKGQTMRSRSKILVSILSVIPMQTVLANETATVTPAKATTASYDDTCIKQALETLPADATLQQLRQQCLKKAPAELSNSPIEKRIQADRLSQFDQFSIQSYQPNYILFGSYNFA